MSISSSLQPHHESDDPSLHARPDSAARRPAWRRLLPILLIVGVAWSAVMWLNRAEHAEPLIGNPAPPLTIESFDGRPIALAEMEGQGVVVNFWASWCEPCRAEATLFERAWQREQAHGIVFIGVNVRDEPMAAQAFIDEFDITFINGPDNANQWARRFGAIGLPATYFIAPDGTVRSVILGPITTAAQLDKRLDAIRPNQSTLTTHNTRITE